MYDLLLPQEIRGLIGYCFFWELYFTVSNSEDTKFNLILLKYLNLTPVRISANICIIENTNWFLTRFIFCSIYFNLINLRKFFSYPFLLFLFNNLVLLRFVQYFLQTKETDSISQLLQKLIIKWKTYWHNYRHGTSKSRFFHNIARNCSSVHCIHENEKRKVS